MKIDIDTVRSDAMYGIKIFDDISDENPANSAWFTPLWENAETQIFYSNRENIFDGELNVTNCHLNKKDKGFCFWLSLEDAVVNTMLTRTSKNFPKAMMLNFVGEIEARDDIIACQLTNAEHTLKFMTNNLTLGNMWDYYKIVDQWIRIDRIKPDIINDKKSVFKSNYFKNCILLNDNDITKYEITISPSGNKYSGEINHTIFSAKDNHSIIVINKTKYTQYLNRFNRWYQFITPIPKFSTVTLKLGECGERAL